MPYVLIFLLAGQTPQTPQKPESALWNYRTGQEFYVEEGQRQLLQIKGTTNVSNYFDYAFLWRYLVQSETKGVFKIEATLDKVRVNNPNEAGGRASELLKLQEGTKSYWSLKKGPTGWLIQPAQDDTGKHAAPLFLTLGTPKIDDATAGWKQEWPMPKSTWGQAELALTMTVKVQTNERLSVTNRGQFVWKPSDAYPGKVVYLPQTPSTVGLGEYDPVKNRWLYFEWRAEGAWQVTSASASSTMKQSQFSYYRYSERRPVFP